MLGEFLLKNIKQLYSNFDYNDAFFVSLFISFSVFMILEVISLQLALYEVGWWALVLFLLVFIFSFLYLVSKKQMSNITKYKKILLCLNIVVSIVFLYVIL